MWQTIILVSAIGIAYVDRISSESLNSPPDNAKHGR